MYNGIPLIYPINNSNNNDELIRINEKLERLEKQIRILENRLNKIENIPIKSYSPPENITDMHII